MRKMYYEELPTMGKRTDWINCVGLTCKFIYDEVEGFINIVGYDKKSQKLTLRYLNGEVFESATSTFKNCAIGCIMGTYNTHYIYNIGDVVNDLKITEHGRNKNERTYKYKCLKCGFDCGEHYKGEKFNKEHWVSEGHLKSGNGCGCCKNKLTVTNINSMHKTDYWMIELGVDEEFAKTHTKGSNKKCKVICRDCGKEQTKISSNIYNRKSIGCMCNGGYYTEKFISNIFNQCNIKTKTQLGRTTFKWCDKYKYDFYFKINDEQYILEAHGSQHYTRDNNFKNDKTLKEEQENDRVKKELALNNGIKEDNYIVIDCRKSELEFIKKNILNSNLSKIVDLNCVNWNTCEEFALSNISKSVCDFYNANTNLSSKEIGLEFNIDCATVVNYLNRWSKLELCSYDGKKVSRGNKKGSIVIKKVEIFKDDTSLGVFPSCSELERRSEELFEVRLMQDYISLVARSKRPDYKGFTFKYVE